MTDLIYRGFFNQIPIFEDKEMEKNKAYLINLGEIYYDGKRIRTGLNGIICLKGLSK